MHLFCCATKKVAGLIPPKTISDAVRQIQSAKLLFIINVSIQWVLIHHATQSLNTECSSEVHCY
jgi:hypothetical protein